jgi:enoyl-CoA hydratase/carnithine racemase
MEILTNAEGPVLIVTINRPEAMNALSPAANDALQAAWEMFEGNDELLVAVLTGAGQHSFSAGADLKTLIPLLRERVLTDDEEIEWNFGGGLARGRTFTKPLICAVNGHCLAGGLEMALGCDIRLASPNATFSLAEVKWAIAPGAGGTVRLPRAVPLGWAMEMLLTGDPIDADTAFRIGLVNHLYPQDTLLDEAISLAKRIASRGPLAVRSIKRVVQESFELNFSQAMAQEHDALLALMRSSDAQEGYRVFSEKRPPSYRGV